LAQAYITQAGDDSSASISQQANVSGDLADINQLAGSSNNSATIVQNGAAPALSLSVATITQRGTDGQATITQTGVDNDATTTQGGSGNISDLIQNGTNNTATVTQTGTGGVANLTQNGVGNTVTVTQN
jgi:hypothetical protein